MKGIIVIPEFYKERITHVPQFLLKVVGENMKFDIQYTNAPSIPSGIDIVLTFALPQHNRPGLMVDYFENLDRRIKLIGYLGDFHCYGMKQCEEEKERLFDRFNMILCGSDERFKEWHPEYMDKLVFFPQFFAPYERYGILELRKKPINQCLFIGAINRAVYPLRHKIKTEGDPSKIKAIHAPAGTGGQIGDAYAQLLNSYACCIATSSRFNYVLAKHFEIPAAGSLLLADETKDLKKVGFKAYEHYVPITMDNVFSQIDIVLNNPDSFLEIREKGMEFVRDNHSVRNRFGQLKEILEGVCDG